MLLSSSLELKATRISHNKKPHNYIFSIFMFRCHVTLLLDNMPVLSLMSESCMGFFCFLPLLLLIFSSVLPSPFTGIVPLFLYLLDEDTNCHVVIHGGYSPSCWIIFIWCLFFSHTFQETLMEPCIEKLKYEFLPPLLSNSCRISYTCPCYKPRKRISDRAGSPRQFS